MSENLEENIETGMPTAVKIVVRYAVSFAIGIAVTAGIYFYEKNMFRSQGVIFSWQRLLCDGSFVASVIFLAVGGMTGIMNHGGFDAVNYAFIKLVDRIRNPKAEDRDSDTYYDYVASKRMKRNTPFVFILLTGAAFFVFAMILVFFA